MTCAVLLPVYNAGSSLPQAIESILSQDYPDFEFWIIDDCSSDGSARVIRSYASADRRICAIVHQRNSGLPSTLNEALAALRADLVVRMDQDDVALPNRVATQVRFMRDRPEVAVAGTFVYHMGRTPSHDRLVTLPVEHEEIVRALPQANCIYHPSVILRREAIVAAGGYRAEYQNSEDYDLWLRISRRHHLANIPVPLLRYRFSVGGMSLGRKWQQALFAQMAVASYVHPEWDFEEVRRQAVAELEKLGKNNFLEQVALGTIRELTCLGLHWDAIRVLWLFSRELDRNGVIRLIRELGWGWLRAWRAPHPSP
jgi:glycosyltransferase involved in cell wall biosynthesis